MQDPVRLALDMLQRRAQEDAARVLSRCGMTLRHTGDVDRSHRETRPISDVLIHAPEDVLGEIRHNRPPQGDWPGQIEHAIRDAMADRYVVRDVQWSETEPLESARRRSIEEHDRE